MAQQASLYRNDELLFTATPEGNKSAFQLCFEHLLTLEPNRTIIPDGQEHGTIYVLTVQKSNSTLSGVVLIKTEYTIR